MTRLLFVIILILASAIEPSDNANILGIFNYPSYSHQLVYQKIVQDLSTKGHHLTIVTVNEINKNYPNVTEILLKDSYKNYKLDFAKSKENDLGIVMNFFWGIYSSFLMFIEHINHPGLKNLIENPQQQKYDLLLIELIFYNQMVYFAELYDCPIVGISPLEASNFVHSLLGNYVNAAVKAEDNIEIDSENMSIYERIVSVASEVGFWIVQPFYEAIGGYFLRKYFPNVTASWSEIHEQRLELLLQNISPVLGATRPVTHNTIMIGNINLEQPKKLDGELESFLNASKNGIIYVSFGTNVNTKSLNSRAMSIFINTFKSLNYDILWKVDDEIMNKSSNIHTSKWYPQAELLAHPNVKLFITHCGLLSLEESIDREVPMIAIPFQFDQYRNSFTVRREQIGKFVEYKTMTEKSLYDAIMETTTNPKYKENIRRLRTLMYDVPMSSREKAVWWIEYVLRNKGHNKLKFYGAKVPFYKKYCLDILAFVVGILSLIKMFFSFMRKNLFVRRVKVD